MWRGICEENTRRDIVIIDANLSNPKVLIEFAEAQKDIAENKFDKKLDKGIVVFDIDIYKNKPDDFKKIYGANHNA